MNLVRDLMTAAPDHVHRDATLDVVDARMRRGRFRHMPVVDDAGRVIGVISDRDLARLAGDVAADRRAAMFAARRVGHVMTTPAVTIEADEGLAEAAERMRERGFGCLPVVDEGRLVGILTPADFVTAYLAVVAR